MRKLSLCMLLFGVSLLFGCGTAGDGKDPSSGNDQVMQAGPCKPNFIEDFKTVLERANQMFVAERELEYSATEERRQKWKAAVKATCEICDQFMARHQNEQCVTKMRDGTEALASWKDPTIRGYCATAKKSR